MTPEPLTRYQLSASNFTVGHYLHAREAFDLNAPYQRQSVWDTEKRRGLIKSLIMGVPIGSVTMALHPSNLGAFYRVVDGKQRIEAVRAFVDGEFSVPGWWFSESDFHEGQADQLRATDVYWSDLSQPGQFMVKMSNLPAVEFKPEVEYIARPEGGYTHRRRNAEEILQAEAELYLLLNFGGVPQTDEDMERAADVAHTQNGAADV